jgi:hypothetical protein
VAELQHFVAGQLSRRSGGMEREEENVHYTEMSTVNFSFLSGGVPSVGGRSCFGCW